MPCKWTGDSRHKNQPISNCKLKTTSSIVPCKAFGNIHPCVRQCITIFDHDEIKWATSTKCNGKKCKIMPYLFIFCPIADYMLLQNDRTYIDMFVKNITATKCHSNPTHTYVKPTRTFTGSGPQGGSKSL